MVVLTVDTGNWTVTSETPLEFDVRDGDWPELFQLDATHYFCVYAGAGADGFAKVFTVDTGNWTITEETSFEFDTQQGQETALCQIDQTHYLCGYRQGGNPKVVVLTVDPATWLTTAAIPLVLATGYSTESSLVKLDATHYLWAYSTGAEGIGTVLTLDPFDWSITQGDTIQIDPFCVYPSLAQIDGQKFLCAYSGQGSVGKTVVIEVDTSNWTITTGAALTFDNTGFTPVLLRIDSTHYLCAYEGSLSYGKAGILEISEPIMP